MPGEDVELILCQGALVVDLVDEGHHRGDGGVVLHLFDVFGNFLHSLVETRLELRVGVAVTQDVGETGDSLEEALASLGRCSRSTEPRTRSRP